MKEVLLRKSMMIDDEMSLESERQSYAPTIFSSKFTQQQKHTRKKPSKKVIQFLEDESCLQSIRKQSLLQKTMRLYARFPILNHEKTRMVIWNAVTFFIIIFYFIEIGFLVGFGGTYWQDEITYLLQVNIIFLAFLLLDMLISPLKTFYDNGILVDNRIVIFSRYFGLYFWLDLIAFVGIMVPYVTENLYSNFFKFLFFAKFVAFYELDKSLMLFMQSRFEKSHIYSIIRIIFFMILWSHWLGVGFFAIDYMVLTSNSYGPNTPNYCWVYNSQLNFNLSQAHWTVQYLYSLYYAVGNITTIAYGDITARNPTQAIFTIISMTISILLFTYFFKSLLQTIFFSQSQKIDNQQEIAIVFRYLKNNSVNKYLATKLKSYFQTSWEDTKLRNREFELQLIDKLPADIKTQLNITIFGQFIISLGLISPFDLIPDDHTPLICQLTATIQLQRMMAGHLLYYEGECFEQNQYVYFCDHSFGDQTITLGVGKISQRNLLEVEADEDKLKIFYQNKMVIASICGLFGEISFFTRQARSHWAIANKHLQLYKLSRSKFDMLLDNYGSNIQKQKVCELKESIQNSFCYICKSKGHSFQKCLYTNYIPYLPHLMAKMKSFNQRFNDQFIAKNRQEWLNYTVKQNSWRLYKDIKNYRASEEYDIKQKQVDNQDQDLDLELHLMKLLIKSRVSKREEKKVWREGFDIDQGYIFKFYKYNNNIDSELKRCNSFLLKKIKQKKQRVV